MPGELRHCTWLPEIEAYTERISQPAISSASSTARWIDCTVDSMSTTTPRLSPRDSCEPMPITSIGLPGRVLADQRDDFRRADVEPDDQCLVTLAIHVFPCNCGATAAAGAGDAGQLSAKPLV